MTAATDLRSLSVQDYHRMVAAGILAADERLELPQAGGDGMEKGYEGDAIAPLAFPDCEAAVGSFCDRAIPRFDYPCGLPHESERIIVGIHFPNAL